MNLFKRQIVLLSRNPTFARKMEKVIENNGQYFD